LGFLVECIKTRLNLVAQKAAQCTACSLHKERTKSVFARGREDAEIMFVGEGPGYHEDQQGLPFVGPAGQLLDKMVGAMGYQRDEVYICNVVKCRPPNNRTPTMEEAGACSGFLKQQISVVSPKIIVALGRCAVEALGCMNGRSWRGSWGEYAGVPVMSTYHPAFLLRSPEFKRVVWEDLQTVMKRLRPS
jgi:DNA polymerase